MPFNFSLALKVTLPSHPFISPFSHHSREEYIYSACSMVLTAEGPHTIIWNKLFLAFFQNKKATTHFLPRALIVQYVLYNELHQQNSL